MREMMAEMVGTFILVQLGLAAGMSSIFSDAFGLFPIAAVWMIAVTLAISCTASISGAHINPAISVALAVFRRRPNSSNNNDNPSEAVSSFGWSKLIPYCIAQLLGAVLGAAVNLILYGSVIRQFEAVEGIVRSQASGVASAKAFGEYFSAPVTVPQAFFAEAFGTAVLAFVVFAVTHPDNEAMQTNPLLVPPLIGLTVAALICILAPLTQAGLNPARDFGPRLVACAAGWSPAVAFSRAWVYLLAPVVGALAGAAVCDKVLYRNDLSRRKDDNDDDDDGTILVGSPIRGQVPDE